MRMLPLLAILLTTATTSLAQQAQPVPEPPPSADEVRALRQRVAALEDEVARLRGRLPADAQTGIVYSSTAPKQAAIPPYASEATVLAERGIPSRVEWGPRGRVLIYGRERWRFDKDGQLVGVERDQ
jgi:hypothetical protein